MDGANDWSQESRSILEVITQVEVGRCLTDITLPLPKNKRFTDNLQVILFKINIQGGLTMEFLNEYMIPVVLGICLVVGYIVKKWLSDVDNKYIPTIVTILGAVLAVWFNDWSVTPEIILSGLVTGAASTGMHQLFTQFIEKKS